MKDVWIKGLSYDSMSRVSRRRFISQFVGFGGAFLYVSPVLPAPMLEKESDVIR